MLSEWISVPTAFSRADKLQRWSQASNYTCRFKNIVSSEKADRTVVMFFLAADSTLRYCHTRELQSYGKLKLCLFFSMKFPLRGVMLFFEKNTEILAIRYILNTMCDHYRKRNAVATIEVPEVWKSPGYSPGCCKCCARLNFFLPDYSSLATQLPQSNEWGGFVVVFFTQFCCLIENTLFLFRYLTR